MTYTTLNVSRGRLTGKIWCGQGHLTPDRLVVVAIVGSARDRGGISDNEDLGPWSPDLPREAWEAGALLMAAKHGLTVGAFV